VCKTRKPQCFVFSYAVKTIKLKIYRIIIFPVVLDGSENWPQSSREEQRLSVHENSTLGRISGQKRNEITRGCRKLQNGELQKLYSLLNIINTF
jgi:hypothetical protein